MGLSLNACNRRGRSLLSTTVPLGDESDVLEGEEELFTFSILRLVLSNDGLLISRRLPGRFEIDEQMYELLAGLMKAIDEHGHRARGFLLDLRFGTGRHEPEFEAMVTKFNRDIVSRYGKVAWLVATNVGLLQARRFARELQIDLRAFQDEGEARRWLLS